MRSTGSVKPYRGKWRARCGGEFLGYYQTEQEGWDVVNAWLIRQGDRGTDPDVLRTFGQTWLDERETDGHVRGIKQERSVWKSRIETAPFIDWPIKRIKPKHVQAWLRLLFKREAMHVLATKNADGDPSPTMSGTGRKLSRQSVVHAWRLLKSCLDEAVISGKLPSNPAREVKMPKREDDSDDGELIVFATAAEVASLLKLGLSLRERAAFSVAIYAGLRPGELWGLRWEDVTEHEIKVRRSFDGPLKTKWSKRDVPLLPIAREALKALKASLDPRPIAGLVFPADGGGCHHSGYTAGWTDKRDRRGGKKVRVTAGLRQLAKIRDCVRFEDLRHTCGCHLVQGSWTPRPLSLLEVKSWLGHSSIVVTERHYARLAPGNLLDAVRGVRGPLSWTTHSDDTSK